MSTFFGPSKTLRGKKPRSSSSKSKLIPIHNRFATISRNFEGSHYNQDVNHGYDDYNYNDDGFGGSGNEYGNGRQWNSEKVVNGLVLNRFKRVSILDNNVHQISSQQTDRGQGLSEDGLGTYGRAKQERSGDGVDVYHARTYAEPNQNTGYSYPSYSNVPNQVSNQYGDHLQPFLPPPPPHKTYTSATMPRSVGWETGSRKTGKQIQKPSNEFDFQRNAPHSQSITSFQPSMNLQNRNVREYGTTPRSKVRMSAPPPPPPPMPPPPIPLSSNASQIKLKTRD